MEIMRLEPGSRIESGVEIWYKGKRGFYWGRRFGTLPRPLGSDYHPLSELPLSLEVPEKEEPDAEA